MRVAGLRQIFPRALLHRFAISISSVYHEQGVLFGTCFVRNGACLSRIFLKTEKNCSHKPLRYCFGLVSNWESKISLLKVSISIFLVFLKDIFFLWNVDLFESLILQ